MSHSLQTLSRRWWSCRVSRSWPTSHPATASCSICSKTRPCWRSASACWRRVYASWTRMRSSPVREPMQSLSVKQRKFVRVFVCSDDINLPPGQVRSTWSQLCCTAYACWTWLCRRRWCSWTSSERARPRCWCPHWSSSYRGSALRPAGQITSSILPGNNIQLVLQAVRFNLQVVTLLGAFSSCDVIPRQGSHVIISFRRLVG